MRVTIGTVKTMERLHNKLVRNGIERKQCLHSGSFLRAIRKFVAQR